MIKLVAGVNDLLTLNPDLASEWDHEKNGDLLPNQLSLLSGKKVWWKCKNGHSWMQSPSVRSRGIGCPYCSGRFAIKGVNDLLTIDPDLASEWNYEKNGDKRPEDYKPQSNAIVWWKCERGHEWQSSICNRYKGRKCPECTKALRTSFPEQAVLYYLSKLYDVSSRSTVNGWEIDIYIPEKKVGIEYDGIFYHDSEKAKKREERKNADVSLAGVRLFRFKETKNKQGIENNILYYKVDNNYSGLGPTIHTFLSVIGEQRTIDIDVVRDWQTIKSAYWNIFLKNNIAITNPDLCKEWDYKRNEPLLPEMFSSGSHINVWWKCKEGHEWKAGISDRVRGTGCPYCSGRYVIIGTNDLLSINPELASEWDYEKNSGKKPEEFKSKSNVKVWWKCKQGHSWKQSINIRMNGSGCPYCSGLKHVVGVNDLATMYPHLLSEWDYDKNTIDPKDIHSGSHETAWWKCSKCGYEWKAPIERRTRGQAGCPACSGKIVVESINSLDHVEPEISKEWDYEKNGELTPKKIHYGSNRKVWWKCSKCGYEWSTSVAHRTGSDKTGCPKCAGEIGYKILCVETNTVFENLNDAAKFCNGSKGNIVRCCRGRTNRAYGYHWKYVEEG